MTPIFADAINFSFVLGAGVVILVPLLAFEIFTEALILRTVWHQEFGDLCRFTFVANIWSLLAGIPAKFLNSWLYSFLLPADLPGYFARYPFAIAIGSLTYFLITIAVEGLYAIRWLRKKQYPVTKAGLWRGVLLANLATYAVLSPLHYFTTRPEHHMNKFVSNTYWCPETNTTVLFVDKNAELHSIRLDGSQLTTLVPAAVRDYLVSTNLNICLFRSGDRSLYLYRRDTGQNNLVWHNTHERFQMDQVAFSPSGEHVAVAERENNYVEVVDTRTGKRVRQVLLPKFSYDGPSVAWSNDEMLFYLRGFESDGPVEVKLQPDMALQIQSIDNTNGLTFLPCFGRLGTGRWFESDDWGKSQNTDSCGDLKVWTEPGLGSGLWIDRKGVEQSPIVSLHVNPGLLQIARFYFGDAAFVGNCQECLFEANGYIYLLDIQNKRVGTLVQGDRFILLTDRYRKGF